MPLLPKLLLAAGMVAAPTAAWALAAAWQRRRCRTRLRSLAAPLVYITADTTNGNSCSAGSSGSGGGSRRCSSQHTALSGRPSHIEVTDYCHAARCSRMRMPSLAQLRLR